MSKNTVVRDLQGNMHLCPGVCVHVVSQIAQDGNKKVIVVGLKFSGRKRESEIFTFEETIPAERINFSLKDLVDYELMDNGHESGSGSKKRAKAKNASGEHLENKASRKIAEKGTLRINGVPGDFESEITLDLTFDRSIILVRVLSIKLMGFVK